MKYLLSLIAMAVASVACAGIFDGYWKGSLAGRIPVVFRISGDSVATLSSPRQGVIDIPCDTIVTDPEARTVRISLKALNLEYKGTMSADGSVIDGTFVQGMALPLQLTPGSADDVALPRPQTPRPPFFYNVEEVTFTPEGRENILAGTLTFPATRQPKDGFTAAVLLTGSGAQNRDEEIMGHKPFAVIADWLTRCGYAVLRFDDPATGSSTPDPAGGTTFDNAAYALSAIEYLKGRKEINPKSIGLIGHSEGALTAFIAAAADTADVAFVISLAGPGVKGKELLIRQNEMLANFGGAPLSQEKLGKVRELFSMIDTTADTTGMRSRAKEIVAEISPELTPEQVAAEVSKMTTPWYLTFVRTDPSQFLSQIKCPLLAINGSWDIQVDADMNLNAIAAAMPSATIVKPEGLNHLLQEAPSYESSFSYGAIEQTISPEVLETISKWLAKISKKD